MKNRIFAIPAAATAMLVNPNTAAMSARMKKVIDQVSIRTPYHTLSGVFMNKAKSRHPVPAFSRIEYRVLFSPQDPRDGELRRYPYDLPCVRLAVHHGNRSIIVVRKVGSGILPALERNNEQHDGYARTPEKGEDFDQPNNRVPHGTPPKVCCLRKPYHPVKAIAIPPPLC